MALFTARKLPAPGWFFGTIAGFPGMCLPRWRASSRPKVSAAAGRVADDEIDGLSGVELFRGLRRSFGGRDRGEQDGDEACAQGQPHVVSLLVIARQE